jgi:hypothetical protein
VKTDGEATTIEADSIEQAIKRLKSVIDKQRQKSSPSDQDKAQLKALEQVVKELKGISVDAKGSGAGKQLDENRRVVFVRRLENLKTDDMTPEKKAEIDQARAKVKKLSEALKSMQKELADAHRKLAQLQGGVTVSARALGIGEKAPRSTENRAVATYRITTPKASTTPVAAARAYGLATGSTSDAKRLSDLEKKLDKLLEEVASLKKDREKGK